MRRRQTRLLWGLAAAVVGCGQQASGEAAAGAARAGGDTTVDDATTLAYGFPAPNLDAEGLAAHLDGDVTFGAKFVAPPAPVNAGLGPLYNNTACSRCHLGDGRGLPVAGNGALGSQLIVQVSAHDGEPSVPGGPAPAPGLGVQLQDHAVVGRAPEASVVIRYITERGQYGDGAPFELQRPVFEVTLAGGAPAAPALLVSARTPPPVFGLGLLEAVPEEALRALEDPADADGDGVSGRLNQVWDLERGAMAPGRFGWKAGSPTLRQQAAAAYANDMGVTSTLLPGEGGEVEVSDQTLAKTTFYTQSLGVPARRSPGDPAVARGEGLFRGFGCARCHVERLETGAHEVAAVSWQIIYPYTDLLLHNMGFDLADGRPEHEASGTEWRTPPLWGIGLAQVVTPGAAFLHDGRARTLDEAVLWHGGEAEASKEAFRLAPWRDRAALLAFLRSL